MLMAPCLLPGGKRWWPVSSMIVNSPEICNRNIKSQKGPKFIGGSLPTKQLLICPFLSTHRLGRDVGGISNPDHLVSPALAGVALQEGLEGGYLNMKRKKLQAEPDFDRLKRIKQALSFSF